MEHIGALIIMLSLLAGCGPVGGAPAPTEPSPTATLEPTAVPTATPVPAPTMPPEPETWDYVAIGDATISLPGDYSYPAQYATLIESDLGVTVFPHTIVVSDMMTDKILQELRTNERWREALGKAKIVTFVAGFDELTYVILNDVKNGTCGGDDGLDCIRDKMTDMGANYDAIYAELFSLCRPGTIVRTETYPFVTLEGFDYRDDIRPYVELLNAAIIQSAATRDIPVAMVDEAFNWPNGTGSSAEQGYTGDWLPTTKLGAERIAELLQDLGYEPTMP